MSKAIFLILLSAGLPACATSTTSRGATLVSGLKAYQGEMQSLGGSVARWPERQQAGTNLKNTITATFGASSEFYRLVDLDLRKREFEITLRETRVPADRVKEMKQELMQIDEELAALKPVIRTQLASIQLESDADRAVEDAAARGLISLALDRFSSGGAPRGFDAPSTKVGRYVVTDLGSFATVRSADGQSFRCVSFGTAEEGAGIRCDP